MTTQPTSPSDAKRPRQFTLAERAKLFPLDYEVVLDKDSKVHVMVRENWERQNLVRIGPYRGAAELKFSPRVHINAAPAFSVFFSVLDQSAEESVMHLIKTYDGGFVARLKRGVKLPAPGEPKSAYDKLLSNHSRGTAIDLNAKWNRMGIPYSPTRMAGEGDLSRIIEIANTIRVKQDGIELGIVCGAHWKGASIDPMHFEIGIWP